MLETLVHFDQQLFHAINHGLSNPFFDWLMPVLRNRFTWVPLYVFLAVYFIRTYGLKTGFILIVFLLGTFALTDRISSGYIKFAVERPRPCNDLEFKKQVSPLVDCGTGYSFPSAHATNHFGMAVFLILVFYRKWGRWILPAALGWAAIISFAQVYVGIHYPLDVTGGAVLGCIAGYLTGILFLAVQKRNKWNPGK